MDFINESEENRPKTAQELIEQILYILDPDDKHQDEIMKERIDKCSRQALVVMANVCDISPITTVLGNTKTVKYEEDMQRGYDPIAQFLQDYEMDPEVKNLKKKYSNFWDYLDAMQVYNNYMDKLVDRYGSKKNVRTYQKIGLLTEFVPEKPKLKGTKENRRLLKGGFIPSRQLYDEPYSPEVYAAAEKMYPIDEEKAELLTEYRMFYWEPQTKEEKKEWKKWQFYGKQAAKDLGIEVRTNSIFSKANMSASADVIVDFVNSIGKSGYDVSGKRLRGGHVEGLVEEIRREADEELIPIEIREARANDATLKNVGGRLISGKQEREMEIMKDLYDAGIDVFRLNGKNMSKSMIRMTKRYIGAPELRNGTLSKKQLKKEKKRRKREQKELSQYRDNDSKLSKILLGNRYNSSAGGQINMRLSDIFHGDD